MREGMVMSIVPKSLAVIWLSAVAALVVSDLESETVISDGISSVQCVNCHKDVTADKRELLSALEH